MSDHIIGLDHARVEAFIEDKLSCINMGGEWIKWRTNFDNVWTATL